MITDIHTVVMGGYILKKRWHKWPSKLKKHRVLLSKGNHERRWCRYEKRLKHLARMRWAEKQKREDLGRLNSIHNR